MGTAGKRTGAYYAGVDDFSIIYPKYETNIVFNIPMIGIANAGSFRDTVYSNEYNIKDYFNSEPYAAYGYSNQDYKMFRNENAPIDLKTLAIHDSFGISFMIFLPLAVRL